MTKIVQATPTTLARTTPQGAQALVEAWLEGRGENTHRAYRADLEDFAAYLQAPSVEDAAGYFLGLSQGEANYRALRYLNTLKARGLKPATINRRLAALRSLVSLGRRLGVVGWDLEVDGVKRRTYKDTRGPGVEAVRRLLAYCGALPNDAKGSRDRALVLLMFANALRREEVLGLDLRHFDPRRRRVSIKGKRREEREWVTIPRVVARALVVWIRNYRGTSRGPLFSPVDRWGNVRLGNRLTGRGVYDVVAKLGIAATGRKVRPHGLRHTGITAALDRSKGDVRKVARFSRHRNVATLQIYDDNRQDFAGEIAEGVAGDLGL